jgi:catechol 2,3-dioxygenase-like lactoylglutathione lyase family enzyme
MHETAQETAMSNNDSGSNAATSKTIVKVDMKVEVIVISVSDVERAKTFYLRLGWRLDKTPPGLVQFTPAGSGCSVLFGANLTSAAPGSSEAFLVVSDIAAARDALVAAGIEVGEIFHVGPGGPLSGPDPEHRSYFTRASISDPDGNVWVLQEVTVRLPGRIDTGVTSFGSANDLASALGRAEAAHGKHEKSTGSPDLNWPEWYAEYMAAEQSGMKLPT